MTIRVNADLFKLVHAAISKEETRYYLNGVFIEPHPVGGAVLVATDGHRMLVAHDEKGEVSGSGDLGLRALAGRCADG